MSRLQEIGRKINERPLEALAWLLAIALAVVTVAWPFAVCVYPPMTDLPMHATQSSALRHFWDPAYHFRDQFELHPLGVPYLSSYILAALLMFFFSAVTAVKIATAVMLLALPVGLGTLAWGMRKSPLTGLYGLPLVWCSLTHWGFINFVSALGIFAACLGLAYRAVDKPSWKTEVALGGSLVLLFFTHVFRFPMAVMAVLGMGVLLYPVTRRYLPLVRASAPSLLFFAGFEYVKPTALDGGLGKLSLHWERIKEIPKTVIHGFVGLQEIDAAVLAAKAIGMVVCLSLGWKLWQLFKPRLKPETGGEQVDQTEPADRASRTKDIWFGVLTHFGVLVSAASFFLLFLVLPIEIGIWWYVYPREVVAACFVVLGLLPGLPEQRWLKLVAVGILGFGALSLSSVVARQYHSFDEQTADFTRIEQRLPPAPKLLYLIYDHLPTDRTATPFIHLPAYIQAEKGGWLSFHFAVFGASPLQFRTDKDAVLAPPVPLHWEWHPDMFDLKKQGPFFDWFLVRKKRSPADLFAADPEIALVAQEGEWWLFARTNRTAVAP